MKRILLTLCLLLPPVLRAQTLRIDDFRMDLADGAAADPRTMVPDLDGEPCAALRIETQLSGWTFDAGLGGIMDVRYVKGAVILYIPAGTRRLTVAHKEYGILRDWPFPTPLESGRTYSMKLVRVPAAPKPQPKSSPLPDRRAAGRPSRETAPNPSVQRDAAPVSSGGKSFCRHFVDMYLGYGFERFDGGLCASGQTWTGLSYTWIGNRIGPYVSAGWDFDSSFSVMAGGAFRLTPPESAQLDWQLYGGAGLIDERLGVEIGTRFGWRTHSPVSKWDFGVGCQLYRDHVVPTVSVGLYIWGIPTVIGLCICLSAI